MARKYDRANHRVGQGVPGHEYSLSGLGPVTVVPGEWFGLKFWTVVNVETGVVISDRLSRVEAQKLADRVNLSPCLGVA